MRVWTVHNRNNRIDFDTLEEALAAIAFHKRHALIPGRIHLTSHVNPTKV